jgi:hypothetical protein
MNNSGISINLTPPMNLAVSAIQIFQCSLSLVPQHAIVDVQSRKLVTVEPTFEKDVSAWLPYTEAKNTGAGNTLMDSVCPLIGNSVVVPFLTTFSVGVYV